MNIEERLMPNRHSRARKRWFRFSLRSLLLLIFIFAVLAVWLSRPTRIATNYVNALNSKDYARANELCIGKSKSPGKIKQQFNYVNAQLIPITLEDLWTGSRRISVHVDLWTGNGIAGGGWTCTATLRGIVVDPIPMM